MNALAASSAELDSASFKAIAELAYEVSGLTLVEEKSSMIRSRLRHRLRDLQLPDFQSYVAHLKTEAGKSEQQHLISALTTNVSHFFRESHHYDTLAEIFRARLPALRGGAGFRIWSAGCSNGQEATSAAMTLLNIADDVGQMDVKILATDIDNEVVQFARAGIYPERLTKGVPPDQLKKYFQDAGTEGGEAHFQVGPQIKSLIHFNPLNLLGPWPMNRKFDVIFCRNVVIYFDNATQRELWPRMKKTLIPKGTLFLGHSERISDPETFGFTCTGPTTYLADPS